jgi:acetoin utilization protein AcuB
MSTPVVTVTLDDSLSVVNEIFSNTKFHHLIVVENNKLFGVVSDRDLLKALSPRIGTAAETQSDLATLNKRVHQIMTRKPIAIKQTDSIRKAIDIFATHTISCLPVIDEKGVPVGILSWRDIFRAITKVTSLTQKKTKQ